MKGNKSGKGFAIPSAQSKEVVVAEVKEVIDTQYKGDGEEFVEVKKEINTIDVKFFEENPVRLNIDYSHTIPMRPYESAKVSVGLSIPIGKEVSSDIKAQIDAAYVFASKYIEEKIAGEIKGIQEYIKTKK